MKRVFGKIKPLLKFIKFRHRIRKYYKKKEIDGEGWGWIMMNEDQQSWMRKDEWGGESIKEDEYWWMRMSCDEWGWIWTSKDKWGWVRMNEDD